MSNRQCIEIPYEDSESIEVNIRNCVYFGYEDKVAFFEKIKNKQRVQLNLSEIEYNISSVLLSGIFEVLWYFTHNKDKMMEILIDESSKSTLLEKALKSSVEDKTNIIVKNKGKKDD